MDKDPLNIKQRTFLNNLLSKKYNTQAEAYIAAGYKSKGKAAESNAVQLIRNNKFQKEYQKALAKGIEKTELSAERVLKEDARIAFADIKEIFDGKESFLSPGELPEDIRRAISGFEIIEKSIGNNGDKEVKYKYRFWDKGKALERLGRHFKLYDDSSGGQIIINIHPPGIIKNQPKKVKALTIGN